LQGAWHYEEGGSIEHPELVALLVLEEGGTPIGFANLMSVFSIWAHGKVLVLDDLYIKKEHQGKGHGREAMAFIEAYAMENGYKRLQFQSELTNPNANKFYESLGFAATDMFFYVKHFS